MRRTRQKRQLTGGGSYINWKEMVEGDWFVGKLTRRSQDAKGNNRYHLELEEFETSARINVTKAVPNGTGEPEVGMTIILNGTTAFDNALENVADGAFLEILYNGKAPLPKNHTYAGTMAHQIEVSELVDDDSSAMPHDIDGSFEPDL